MDEVMGFKEGDWVRATKTCSGAIKGEKYQVEGSDGNFSIAAGCCCISTWKKIEEGETMKKVWEVLVIDGTKDEIIVREVVIDGDEKSACSKVSIAFAAKLKDIVFDNLCYITKELGSYESKKK